MKTLFFAITFFLGVTTANAFEPDEIIPARWFCDDLESMERLTEVAKTSNATAAVAAIINEAGKGDDATCHIFYEPILVRLVEKQYDFVDVDPFYLVEVWSIKNGSVSGYSFVGTPLGPST